MTDIITVFEVFPKARLTTPLWFSLKVIDEAKKFRVKGDPDGRFWKKLKWASNVGFPLCQRGDILKAEWNGVFRFGIKTSLFRIVGFYAEDGTQDFIAIDAFLKSGQKLGARERQCIDFVVEVKKYGRWRKNPSPEWTPRLVGGS
jgi:hypothetical protein